MPEKARWLLMSDLTQLRITVKKQYDDVIDLQKRVLELEGLVLTLSSKLYEVSEKKGG